MSDPRTHIDGATAIDLAHDRTKISTLIDRILDSAHSQGYSTSSLFAVRLAIEEAITNAFEHGHHGLDPALTVHIEYAVSSIEIEIAI